MSKKKQKLGIIKSKVALPEAYAGDFDAQVFSDMVKLQGAMARRHQKQHAHMSEIVDRKLAEKYGC